MDAVGGKVDPTADAFLRGGHSRIMRGAMSRDPEVGVYDESKVDDAVLALLHLNAFKDHGGWRAWKSFDWDAMSRLHEAGLITDPRSRAKSVLLTEEGATKARQLSEQLFGVERPS